MGMEQRWATIRGPEFMPAWRKVQDEDLDDRGSDYYSGSLSHVNGLKKVSEKDFEKYQEGDLSLNKGDAVYYCKKEPKGNSNKIQSSVERFPNKGTRKWVTKYALYPRDIDYSAGSYDKQEEAVKRAREYSEKNHCRVDVHIEKHLEKYPTKVATTNYKPSSSQKDGIWQVYAELPS
jgi:hypothetical protein